ncbi:hypothetical protein AB5I41_18365 [Sphingomonas sp. MMS24-JH45]
MIRFILPLFLLAAARSCAAGAVAGADQGRYPRAGERRLQRPRAGAGEGEAPTLAFLEKRFRDLGLRTERQAVPMVRLTRTRARFVLNGQPLTPGREIAATSGIVGTTRLEPTSIVFAGYGIVAKGYDPYAGVNVKGGVVVLLAGDPDGEAGRDLGFGGRALALAGRTKAAEAWKPARRRC